LIFFPLSSFPLDKKEERHLVGTTFMADNTKQQVREFYDQIGWSQVGEGLYQNAR